jgi:hypothetical protein
MSAWKDFEDIINIGRKQERDRIREALSTYLVNERSWTLSALRSLFRSTELLEIIPKPNWRRATCPICGDPGTAPGDPGRVIHQKCVLKLGVVLRDIFGEEISHCPDLGKLEDQVREGMNDAIHNVLEKLGGSINHENCL